ncbi:hypothetical protein KSP35_19970 [Aquihabitans sp. G128]|uniref:hypothetical protein n=1 Tax=Aquihabitans sp. G128 TaxID=2849779 RepID=UPI001C23FC9D|nr:hypothetical protein [Aquihabitans sp. G128]QXC60574.1 hypothetical protein KSP35_19970 [Aquihabitans sp. G128]
MAHGTVQHLVGVYDADGTLWGELSYFVGARLGRAHCSLCDITHGTLRERPDWRTCRDGLPVPFETYHRNDQPDRVRVLVGGSYPAVAAETDAGWVLLLGSAELEACGSSPEALVAAVEAAVEERSLRWP